MNPTNPNTPPAADPNEDAPTAFDPNQGAPESPAPAVEEANDTPQSEAFAEPAPVEPTQVPTPNPFEAPAAAAGSETPDTQTTSAPQQADTPAFGSTESAPTPGQVPITPVPATGPGKSKKPLLLVAIIGGAIILIIAAVLAYLAFTTVSKEDYAAAAAKFNDVSSANSTLSSKASVLSSNASDPDDVFNQDVKAFETAMSDLTTQNEELGKLKAVQVGEGKTRYDEFNNKLTAFTAYNKDILSSVKSVRPALVACKAVGDASSTAERTTAIQACADAFNSVGDISNPEFKTLADTLKVEYGKYAKAYAEFTKITDPFGAQRTQYTTLRDEIYDIQDAIRTATNTFSKAVKDRQNELSVKESAQALASYLNEQQR